MLKTFEVYVAIALFLISLFAGSVIPVNLPMLGLAFFAASTLQPARTLSQTK